MAAPANLFRLLQEVVFILLGGLLALLAASGEYIPDRSSLGWRVLAAVTVIWGLRAWWHASRKSTTWHEKLAGGSLILVGGLMMAIGWAPFVWIRPLLAAAGAVLALRGLAGTAAAARSR